MKLRIIITDEKGDLITGNMDTKASPAEYFTACVKFFADLTGDGKGFKQLAQEYKIDCQEIDEKTYSQTAIVSFIQLIHKHQFFATQKVLVDTSNPNHDTFVSIAKLGSVTSAVDPKNNVLFVHLLNKMKIPGIDSIFIAPVSQFATKEQPYGPYKDFFSFTTSQLDQDLKVRRAMAYLYGVGIFGVEVKQDMAEAMRMLGSAAEKENTPAGRYAKGVCYELGIRGNDGLDQMLRDPVFKARTFFYWIGATTGDLVLIKANSEDRVEALKCYRASAASGYPPAKRQLAVCYYQGKLGVEQNREKALKLFSEIADSDSEVKQFLSAIEKKEAKPTAYLRELQVDIHREVLRFALAELKPDSKTVLERNEKLIAEERERINSAKTSSNCHF